MSLQNVHKNRDEFTITKMSIKIYRRKIYRNVHMDIRPFSLEYRIWKNLENAKYGGYALSLRHSSKQNVALVTRYIESFNAPVRSSNITWLPYLGQ